MVSINLMKLFIFVQLVALRAHLPHYHEPSLVLYLLSSIQTSYVAYRVFRLYSYSIVQKKSLGFQSFANQRPQKKMWPSLSMIRYTKTRRKTKTSFSSKITLFQPMGSVLFTRKLQSSPIYTLWRPRRMHFISAFTSGQYEPKSLILQNEVTTKFWGVFAPLIGP